MSPTSGAAGLRNPSEFRIYVACCRRLSVRESGRTARSGANPNGLDPEASFCSRRFLREGMLSSPSARIKLGLRFDRSS
ncbi:hypothetical protein BHM03_00046571 [Ensete ventricosum]|uniref:Uncharacterized protein n=1 Tax=Ensete ventricosum TaxID=4639 RepID=A0A445MKZ2_ENSVE|nr:hypothetical protein BHM03_00046571 [Ensete ventricosum]